MGRIIFSLLSTVLFSRITNGIDVCNALSNKTNGLFDYGIQLMDSNVNVSDVKDKNLVFIGEHYWEVDINGDFVKISHLQSSISGHFSGTFQMGFYYLYLSHHYRPEPKYCNYIGLFDINDTLLRGLKFVYFSEKGIFEDMRLEYPKNEWYRSIKFQPSVAYRPLSFRKYKVNETFLLIDQQNSSQRIIRIYTINENKNRETLGFEDLTSWKPYWVPQMLNQIDSKLYINAIFPVKNSNLKAVLIVKHNNVLKYCLTLEKILHSNCEIQNLKTLLPECVTTTTMKSTTLSSVMNTVSTNPTTTSKVIETEDNTFVIVLIVIVLLFLVLLTVMLVVIALYLRKNKISSKKKLEFESTISANSSIVSSVK